MAEKTGAQIAVATVNSLDGQPIRDVSLDMLRSWGLGDKDKDNGVLILLAVEDRQSAIEVGYGLEGALPDGKTGRIQDERMLPHFREGEYETGLAYGYQEIYNIVCEEYGIDPSEISYFQSPLPTPATPATDRHDDRRDRALGHRLVVFRWHHHPTLADVFHPLWQRGTRRRWRRLWRRFFRRRRFRWWWRLQPELVK